jgi:hypothetical protein
VGGYGERVDMSTLYCPIFTHGIICDQPVDYLVDGTAMCRVHIVEHLSENKRRDLAQINCDEIDVESAVPVAPKRLGQMISFRLDSEIVIALRDLATERGVSVSDLLREGATMVLVTSKTDG